jgi:NADPH:quinone reductase-like Zn-dependent oxidoreductase
VYGRISAARHGAAAQYTLLLPEEAAHVPKGMSMTEAASVPMSAHTAWQALFEQGMLTGSFTPVDVPHVTDDGTSDPYPCINIVFPGKHDMDGP